MLLKIGCRLFGVELKEMSARVRLVGNFNAIAVIHTVFCFGSRHSP